MTNEEFVGCVFSELSEMDQQAVRHSEDLMYCAFCGEVYEIWHDEFTFTNPNCDDSCLLCVTDFCEEDEVR